VEIESLSIGDIIVVKPNSKISADGIVVSGESSVNQAPITGESVPVDKVPVDAPQKDYSNEKISVIKQVSQAPSMATIRWKLKL